MALTKCPECGKEISDMAKTCPYCGFGIAKLKKKSISKKRKAGIINNIPVFITLAVIGIVIVVGAIRLLGPNFFSSKKMDKEVYNCGIHALEAVDKYLDYEMSASEVSDLLKQIGDDLDDLHISRDSTDALLLGSSVLHIGISINMYGRGSGSREDILEDRNDLAETLGKKGLNKSGERRDRTDK